METLLKIAITSQPARNVSVPQKLVLHQADLTRRTFMGSTADKIKGTANEAMGKAKQGVGEAVGSDRLQGEGAVQEVKGKGQKALGDAKEATKDAVNDAAAAANRKL
jgi:uncharacterized protein YjbJ (UPF0337 family)